MEILNFPSSPVLTGNMQKVVVSTSNEIAFVLKSGTQTIVEHSYNPNAASRIEIDLKSIITPLLTFKLSNVTTPYQQPDIMKEFTVSISEIVNGTQGTATTRSFKALRGGVDDMAETTANFLKANFLTWQPNVKGVTYYTPEFLTYYAAEAVTMKATVHLDGGTTKDIIIATLATGKVWTVPVGYAVIKAKVEGTPLFYDVWIENAAGNRLTYLQRYYAENMKSVNEDWVLFENSLGGIDTFRAYGNTEHTAEHTHNIAEIDEDSQEYRVDTNRTHNKNTGYLDKKERVWLLDFFPSTGKYIYTGQHLRRIVVTESDVTYTAKELPSSYTFKYKYADARPYLNIPRTDTPQDVMNISAPDLGSFTIAPRLVEFPRQTLSEGALFPVQDPNSEGWGVTSFGELLTYIKEQIEGGYQGDGSVGHTHANITLLNALSLLKDYLMVQGKKISAGYADKAGDLTADSPVYNKFVRKDVDDTVAGLLTFLKGLNVKGKLDAENIETDTITIDKGEETPQDGGKTYMLSSGYVRGGKGFGIFKDANGAWGMDIENLEVRGSLSVNELRVDQTKYMGGEVLLTVGGSIKATEVETTGDGWKVFFETTDDKGREIHCQMEAKDLAKCQTWNEKEGQHFYWLEVTEVGDDYITLQRLAKDTTPYSEPRVGDEIIHLGNTENKERQAALIFSAKTQSMRIWTGINTTSLSAANAPIDLNPVRSKILAQFITMSTGETLDVTIKAISEVMGVLVSDTKALKEQADRQFVIWFLDYIPTLTNKPYTEWIADGKDERDMHLQDVCYNKSTDLSAGGGRAWRFEQDEGGNYLWREITDRDTLLALEKAAKAQKTADGKCRVFVVNDGETPPPPYDEGDMWTNATYSSGDVKYDNDTLVVKKGVHKAAGESFSIADWQPASSATTAALAQLGDQIIAFATNTNDSLNDIRGKVTTAQDTANKAVDDAARGIALANIAQSSADQNAAALSVTNKNITALVEGGYLNSDGTIKNKVQSIIDVADNHIAALSQYIGYDPETGLVSNIDKSGLVQTTDFVKLFVEQVKEKELVNSTSFELFKNEINATVEKIHFDDSGNITNINTSKIVLRDDFAGLFSKQVTEEGLVTEASVITAVENGISQAVIQADQIQLSGKTIINDYFVVDKVGNVTLGAKDAERTLTVKGVLNATSGVFENCTIKETCTITKISATTGTIAGFKIEGNGLTNDPFENDAYIIFRNDAKKAFAGIGGNVLPSSSGLRAVARFENDDDTDQWGLDANYAMILSAKNGTRNYAFAGSGNGVLNGWIGGFRYQKVTLTKSDTIMGGALSLFESNQFIIYAPSNIAFGGVELPRLSHVRNALSIGTSTNFCVMITVTIDALSNNAYVYGRNKLKDSTDATPWNATELPVILNNSGGVVDRKYMVAGDFITLLLVYDSAKTGTLDGFDLKYTARIVNLQE